jgi:hypothetical protein
MRKAILTMVLSVVCISGALAGNLKISKFVGLWDVDFDRTMEEAKKSPKYNEKEAERMPAMIKRMMGKMKIKLTDKQMIYVRGTKEVVFPYSVKSSDDKSVTIEIRKGDDTATVAFILIDGKYMNFKSSASDDMHYYVWKKGAVKKTEKKE